MWSASVKVVRATAYYDDPDVIAKASLGLGEAMAVTGSKRVRPHRLSERGW